MSIRKLINQVQRALRKIKPCLTENEYKKLYPQGSSPAQFYGTAKVYKIPPNSTVADDLPLRPIISNIGSATYNTSKYLAKFLTPLTKSTYTTESSLDFISSLKGEKIPHNYKLVSFDVTSLFTNVPLEQTIDIILKRTYVEKVIETKIKREEMKHLLILCTKHVHFSFNNQL